MKELVEKIKEVRAKIGKIDVAIQKRKPYLKQITIEGIGEKLSRREAYAIKRDLEDQEHRLVVCYLNR